MCCCLRPQWESHFLLTRACMQEKYLLEPTKISPCYHHIPCNSSHLLAHLSHISNEATLTHPVSRVFRKPSRQKSRFSMGQVCAIWMLLLSIPWWKISLPQGTPVPQGPHSVLLSISVERWQRAKTNFSSVVEDLWRRNSVYLGRLWNLVFQEPHYSLFWTQFYFFPIVY